MELVLTQMDIEPLPKQKSEPFVFNNEGLLTSNYKEEIHNNFFHSNYFFLFWNVINSSRNEFSIEV